MISQRMVIYGSYGYTGRLVAELAVQRGLKPILAGRNADKLQSQADRLGLAACSFALNNPTEVRQNLADVAAVVHCAGPFSHTAEIMADACLETGAHYIDITGEIDVFEALEDRDVQAKAAGVMLLPGAGFDVVPSDCLALHLKRRLPTADHLALASFSITQPSRGTARSSVERIDSPGMVRRDGQLVQIPAGSLQRNFDFGRGPKPAVAIAWGDLSTAWRSTAIPNIETYMALSPAAQRLLRISRKLGRILITAPAQRIIKAAISLLPEGPDAELRKHGQAIIYGEVTDAAGKRVAARLATPEPYMLTALTALGCVEQALAGHAKPGYQTPATAFGEDFILEFEGCSREAV